MTPRLPRRRFHALAGSVAAAGVSFWFDARFGRAAPPGTWTLYAPCTTTGIWPSCASDYSGHPDHALDFAEAAGTPVKVYFNAGPFVGWCKITDASGWSCSTACFSWHKRVSFELYDDCAPALKVGSGVASHVTSSVANGQWYSGAGGTIAFIAAGQSGVPQPPSNCWTAVHVHYGAPGMTKVPTWGSCHAATAGKTACWNKYHSGC